MTKELKALERIGNYQVVTDYEKDEVKTIKELLPSSYEVVETALKRLEKIDKRDSVIGIIEEEPLDIVSKKLKALEIIKEMLGSDIGYKLNANSRKILKEIFESLPKEKQDLLKEALL